MSYPIGTKTVRTGRRKMIAVEQVRDMVNRLMETLPPNAERDEFRLGAASVLEAILHKTNNYNGFTYIESPFERGKTNETRRCYY